MYELLKQFENLVVLKTMMDMIECNFIDTVNLQQIADVADELDIHLDYQIDFDNINASEYNELYDIYIKWFDDINNMYLNVKNGLLKLI